MITSYSDLLHAARDQTEPQRLLFVFCRAELPDDATDQERADFERGDGGALTPVVCVDKRPEEVADFASMVAESRQTGVEWDVVFVAAMGPTLASFAREADAANFAATHGGAVLPFHLVTLDHLKAGAATAPIDHASHTGH